MPPSIACGAKCFSNARTPLNFKTSPQMSAWLRGTTSIIVTSRSEAAPCTPYIAEFTLSQSIHYNKLCKVLCHKFILKCIAVVIFWINVCTTLRLTIIELSTIEMLNMKHSSVSFVIGEWYGIRGVHFHDVMIFVIIMLKRCSNMQTARYYCHGRHNNSETINYEFNHSYRTI